MLVIHDGWHASDLPGGGIGTIGNFDGVHRGHRAILSRVVTRARETGLPAVVTTFEPHPLSVLDPENAPPRLTTAGQRRELLEEAGIEALVELAFTPEFAETPASEFADFVWRRLGLAEIYVGSRFVFGRDRVGDLELLRRTGREAGGEAHGVEEVYLGGEPISSTRIRAALGEGRVEEARQMLGRPYALCGIVARGDRMGQKIGWPTVNLQPENELIPADGVYATHAVFPSLPGVFPSATNIGNRPTVYENHQRVVESHLLDFRSNVYGEEVEIRFFKRLREERIFPTIMDLSAQIGRDVEAAREYFTQQRRSEERAEARP